MDGGTPRVELNRYVRGLVGGSAAAATMGQAIDAAVATARADASRPSLIMVQTVLGYGAPGKQGTFEAHGSPLGPDEVLAAKENLGWPIEPSFYIPDKALAHMRQDASRGNQSEQDWNANFVQYEQAHPELAAQFKRAMGGQLPPAWDQELPELAAGPVVALVDAAAHGDDPAGDPHAAKQKYG